MGNFLNTRASGFSVLIHGLITDLEVTRHLLKCMWVPNHVGTKGNEKLTSKLSLLQDYKITVPVNE